MLDAARPHQGEFVFSDADFRSIAGLLREDAGINLPPGKSTLVYARLAKRLRTLGMKSFGQYVGHLQGPEGAGERRHMVTALTTNVTRFFREAHHFEHLRTADMPDLLRAAQRGARVRLWSAACSTGQEAYSIAAVVAELLPEAASLDVRILATDIDPVVLEQAEAGAFSTLDGVPRELRRWFSDEGDGWRATPALHGLLRFRQLNLTKPWPFRGPFDVVFCRNVAIYFDTDVQCRLWLSLSETVGPGGMLYIGHSERLSAPAIDRFESVGITAYRRKGPRA